MAKHWRNWPQWVRRILGLYIAFSLIDPWVIASVRKFYDVHPNQWVYYTGKVLVMIFVMAEEATTYLSRRLDNSTVLDLPVIIVIFPSLVFGFILILLSQQVHDHVRLLVDHAAFNRYVSNGGDCPALKCLKDKAGVTGFAWAANDKTWSGVCYDPTGVLKPARRAAREDRRAGRPAQPRVFGAEVQVANGLWGNWFGCVASTRRIELR